jgi:3-oxoadipate enol-lactonase
MDKLHVLRAGSGPRLLLLHGIGASATAWGKQIDRLSPDFTCMAPDLPGYGDSPPPAGEGITPILDAVVDLLDGQAAHVLGVSFGALLALALAHQHPHLVRSLVLSDATLGRAYLSDVERERWLQGRQALAQDLQARSMQRAAEIAAPGAAAQVIEEIATHMRRARPDGYMAVARAIAATDARPWLASIGKPALVLCGEEDHVTGADVSQTLANALPGASLHTIKAAGHAPHVEQPDQFAQAVRKFLGALESTADA